MTTQTAPFSLDQIGTGTARFPSGMAIPTPTDAMVDPYIRTRVSKDVHVECVQFWPQDQDKVSRPGIVLLHDWWGMNSQITALGARLACEGYGVIIPKLYGRLGGMVTGNAEVAEALAAKCNHKLLLQDINSCCEYLNTTERTKRNIHGVVGFGLGASLAIQFACQRKRLRAAVAYYGKVVAPDQLTNMMSPLLYHQAEDDTWATQQDVDLLRAAANQGKRIEIKTYPGTAHAFCDETRQGCYNAEATAQAWDATVAFLKASFQGA
ncbi:MAG: dienelactone hydrolase family protein [Nitrospira sp.]|nr:dienelactone hydrolase family protein [Nitrospira sp.]